MKSFLTASFIFLIYILALPFAEAQDSAKIQNNANNSTTEVLTFAAWKAQAIAAARVQDKQQEGTEINNAAPILNDSILVRSAAPSRPATDTSTEQSSNSYGNSKHSKTKSQEKTRENAVRVQMAQELSVNDYFLLYLQTLPNQKAFAEAVKNLSSEEIVELLWAYRQHMESSRDPSLNTGPSPIAPPENLPSSSGSLQHLKSKQISNANSLSLKMSAAKKANSSGGFLSTPTSNSGKKSGLTIKKKVQLLSSKSNKVRHKNP